MSAPSVNRLFAGLPAPRKSAGRTPLRKAISSKDPAAFHRAWNAFMEVPRERFLKKRVVADLMSLWSVDDIELSGRERELAASIEDLADLRSQASRTSRGARKAEEKLVESYHELIANWLVEATSSPGDWETIAVCELVLICGPALPAETLLSCCRLLWSWHAEHRSDAQHTTFQPSPDVGFIGLPQTLNAEARWVRELILSPFEPPSEEAVSAGADLNRIMTECTDSEGMIHGSLFSHLREWLTPLARVAVWGAAFDRAVWTSQNEDRFRTLVEKSAALIGSDGEFSTLDRAVISDETSQEDSATSTLTVLKQAARMAEYRPTGKVRRLLSITGSSRKTDREIRRCIRRLSSETKKKSDRRKSRAAAWQSDQSSALIVRSSFEPAADLLVAEWHSAEFRMYLSALGLPVFSGSWQWSVTAGEQTLSSSATWNCTCWFVDEEVAFAELESQPFSGVRVHRHLLIAPKDHFAVLTDSIVCDEAEKAIQWESLLPIRSGLPVGPELTVDPDQITREIRLMSGELVVRVFPLWLDDDRVVYAHGALEADDQNLRITARGKGGLVVPLVLDWHPARTCEPADWARLTVSEARRNVTSHEAGAARLRIGSHQIMMYRSLMRPQVNRTVLGLHTGDESVYGRVPVSGQVEPLVQVEASAPDSTEATT
ncbi:MAG: hypothetical protein JNL58_12105 [Planctomyces sp.]|nr:hypothetical protein [Planctomyces sp.]